MVPGTAFLHACRYLDSRGAPTPHLRTPHAGAARTYPHPACTQKVPGNKVFRIWQAGALDSGNKIAASAHGMGSGGLAVDAMAIGCLGVERRVERFFSYLAILPEYCLVQGAEKLWLISEKKKNFQAARGRPRKTILRLPPAVRLPPAAGGTPQTPTD